MTKPLVIAIDGASGSGKSSTARGVAERLGLAYLDTGAMYRAVTLAAMRRGIDPADTERVAALARQIDLDVSEAGVFVDGSDFTTDIRTHEVTTAVSAVAANSAVRAELVRRQREWAHERGGGVLEGRDIGSVVFPDAELKLYLTADPRIRAERRVAESGGNVDDIAAAIERRDRHDTSRADGPLVEAHGAIVLDTSGLEIDEVVDRIQQLMEPE